jgi:hypothetical protein
MPFSEIRTSNTVSGDNTPYAYIPVALITEPVKTFAGFLRPISANFLCSLASDLRMQLHQQK